MAVNIQYLLHTMLATPDLPPENQVIPKNPHPPPPGVITTGSLFSTAVPDYNY